MLRKLVLVVVIVSAFALRLPMAADSMVPLFSDSMAECTDRPLELVGTMPSWLDGTLIRNGPACFGTSEREYCHLFDGLSKLTSYRIRGGRASFTAQFLKSEWWKSMVKNDKLPPSVTTGPVNPPFSFLERIRSVLSSGAFDNVPVNIHQLGGAGGPWVATTDAPVMVQFNPGDLSTVGRLAFKDSISSAGGVELFSTAHPKTASDGSTLNYFLELRPGRENVAKIVRTDASLKRVVLGQVGVGPIGIPYVHDISITDKYAVLAIWPIRIDPLKLFSGTGFLSNLEWAPKEQPDTRIYVFDLLKPGSDGSLPAGPVASFTAPPLFAYHHINSWEEADGGITFDVSGYSTPGIVNGEHAFAYLANVRDKEKRRLQERDAAFYRFNIPGEVLRRGSGHIEPLKLFSSSEVAGEPEETTAELVTINPAFARRKSRYSYGFTGFAGKGADRGGFEEWAIVKLDHDAAAASASASTSTALLWKAPHCFPSEPIMVPSGEGGEEAEDDGVVLSQCYDAAREESFLLVLDAKDMTELARAYLGMVCPSSFHGRWMA